MKTNKSYTKRLRTTKNGKVLERIAGGSHFNAKESREKQLKRKTLQDSNRLSNKEVGRFLPGTKRAKK